MPAYTTIDEVKSFVKTLEECRVLREAAASQDGKNTFLSHSLKDNALVPGVVLILQNHGAKVYVDLGDDRLPQNPSVETAQVLRSAVRSTRRFVLLVSPNSKGSKWIPWELGLADGQKFQDSVALFPVVQSARECSWAEQEYLGLYRRITWGKLNGFNDEVWMVYDHHTKTATELAQWFHGS